MKHIESMFRKQFGPEPMSALVVGGSGGIGGELVHLLLSLGVESVWATSRAKDRPASLTSESRLRWRNMDITIPETIGPLMEEMGGGDVPPLRLVIVATGVLHEDKMQPEKRLSELQSQFLLRSFQVNSVGPMMVAQGCTPMMPRKGRVVFASLGARVGSIEDNRLGGWYGYRASKAALVQFLKTLSIEWRRRAPESIAIALHPGTVDTDLSSPFQRNVPPGKLFGRERAARQLLTVIVGLTPADTGTHVAWDGQPIPC